MVVEFSRGLRACLLGGVSAVVVCGAAAAQEPPRTTEDLAIPQTQGPAVLPGSSTTADPGQQPATGSGEEANAVDEVVVVGSRILGSKVTGALPVTVVDQTDVAATGAVSADELFRSIPQAGDVNFQEARTVGNLNDARGDVASINLRSLGTGNTLVLLNGRRVVPHPGTQTENFVPVQTANVNAIPVSAIRRIEVLRDGAGAIYGADAVAGVVNNVLDTSYEGLRLEALYGAAENAGEASFNFKAGTRLTDGTRLTAFGSYTKRDPLFATDRDFSASEDQRPRVVGTPFEGFPAFDLRSTSSPFAVFDMVRPRLVRQGTTALTNSAGQFHIQPPANTLAGCTSAVLSSGICIRSGLQNTAASRALRYDENPDRTIRGDVERTNLFGALERDLRQGVQLFAEAGYYHSVFTGQREQSALLGSGRIAIPAGNFYNPFGPTILNGAPNPNRLPGLSPAAVPTQGLDLILRQYRPVDAGPRTYIVTDNSYRLLAGLRGRVRGFDWEGALAYSEADTEDKTQNTISNTLFQQALARSTPDAYNPFNGGDLVNFSGPDTSPSNAAAIQSFLVDVFRISHTSLALADLKFTRPDLFTLPGGEVGMAVGVEARRETYEDDRDPRSDGTITFTDIVTGAVNGSDILGASPAPDVKADRSIYSAFIEFAVPVVSREMNIPLVQEVSLQLAARNEYYSDFGNVLAPKIAGSWEVADWLSFRGSYSESFQAPNLPQFYSEGAQVSNTRTDFIRCEQDLRARRITSFSRCGQSFSATSLRSGNQNLEPEDAVNISAGVILESSFIPRRFGELVVTVDYWEIEQEGVIGIFGDLAQLQLDYLLRLRGSSNPNVVRFAPSPEDIAATVPGIAPVGDVQFITDNYTNLRLRTSEGLDFGLLYSVNNTRLGDFDVKLNAAKLLTLEQQPSADAKVLIAAIAAGEISSTLNVPGAGDLIGDEANPEWRASANLTWTYGSWRTGLFISHIGSVFDRGITLATGEPFEIESWTTASLYVQREFETGILADSSLRVGARNIMDEEPPLAANNFGFLGGLHNPLGRFVYAQVAKRF